MSDERASVRLTEEQAKTMRQLLNASISAHLWIGENVRQQGDRERVISYAVMAALEVAISDAGGELVGDSFESLAVDDPEARAAIMEVQSGAKR